MKNFTEEELVRIYEYAYSIMNLADQDFPFGETQKNNIHSYSEQIVYMLKPILYPSTTNDLPN